MAAPTQKCSKLNKHRQPEQPLDKNAVENKFGQPAAAQGQQGQYVNEPGRKVSSRWRLAGTLCNERADGGGAQQPEELPGRTRATAQKPTKEGGTVFSSNPLTWYGIQLKSINLVRFSAVWTVPLAVPAQQCSS